MEQIYQSAILQALGWAIADSVWQMALLWLVYQVCIAIPVKNPVIRHAGAAAAIFIGGIWFLGNVIFKILQDSKTVWTGNGKMDPTVLNWLESLLPYLSSAYLVVLFVLLFRYIYAIVHTQRLRIAKPAGTSEWQLFVDDMALRFFIARKVWIQVTDLVDVPATIGYIKPIILLPIASVNHLSVSQVEAIIMHELSHIKRHDYLINLLVSFIETILFFNPFTYLLSRQIRKECELCCDDAVLKHQQDPGQYAYALLLLEKNRQQFALAMAATGTEGLLLGRVKRILKQPEQKVKYRQRLIALVMVAVLIMGLSVLSPARKETPILATESSSVAQGPTQFIRGKSLLAEAVDVTDEDSKSQKHADPGTDRTVQEKLRTKSFPPELFRVSTDQLDPTEALAFIESPVAPLPPLPPRQPVAPSPVANAFGAFPGFEAPSPPSPDDLVPALREIPEIIHLKGIRDNELEAFLLDMTNAKISQEKAQAFEEMAREFSTAGNLHIVTVDQMKKLEQQHKVMEDKLRYQELILQKQRSQNRVRVMAPARKAGGETRKSTNDGQEYKEDEPAYRSYSYATPIAPAARAKVKTYRDENGFTISIVEEEKQIRIQFSGN